MTTMAQQYGDAILTSMISARDPMTSAIRKNLESETARAELELDKERNEFSLTLQKQIDEGKENGVDGRVLEAWQRLLVKHTSI